MKLVGLSPHESIQQLVTRVLLKLGELYPSERITPAHTCRKRGCSNTTDPGADFSSSQVGSAKRRVSERIVEQNEDVPMPWIKEEFVEFVGVLVLLVWVHVVKLILLEHTQQVDPGGV